MKQLRLHLCAQIAAAVLFCPAMTSAQVPITITIPALDAGRYDVFGEHEEDIETGTAGLTVESRARGPFRSFMVFEIPPFPGVLLNASISAQAYTIGPDGPRTLHLHQVTNSAAVVRQPGFFATNIYADLGDGPTYVSHDFPLGVHDVTVPLSNAVGAITAARGGEFTIGGDHLPLTDNPALNDFILFPYQGWAPLVMELQLSVPPQPIIYQQPRVMNLYSNDALVTVGASGEPPLAYTWYVDGQVHESAWDYRTFALRWLDSNATVYVVVSNNLGAVTSSVVTVPRLPARLEWPETNIVARSHDSVFAHLRVNYQVAPTTLTWRKDGVPFSNDNPFTGLYFPQAQPSNSGAYTVVASNAWGAVTSAVLRVEVMDVAPRFWQNPQNSTNALGDAARFQAFAAAGPPPVYRWYRNGQLLPGISNQVPNLYVAPLQWSDAGNYYVVASNRAGLATSAVATLTIVLDPPVIDPQPQSQMGYAGTAIKFSPGVRGRPYPSLQWYFNGTPIPNARSVQLVLPNPRGTNSGNYFLVASNASGVVTSEVATLTILELPPVLSGPQDTSAAAGHTMFLSLLVSNPPADVLWYPAEGGPPQGSSWTSSGPGAPSVYGVSFLAGRSNYIARFYAVASNEFGVTTSRMASITVTTAPPRFTARIQDFQVVEGSDVTILVPVRGAPAPRLQLFRHGQPVSVFQQSTVLTLFNVTPEQSGEYIVVATNDVGTTNSEPFRIDVQRVGPLDRWTRRHPSPQGNDLHALTFANGKFVACGDAGTVIVSTNATNWSVFSANVPAELQSVAYGNGVFVCVGDYNDRGVVVVSSNAQTWVTQQLPDANRLQSIAFGAGRFLAVGLDTPTGMPRAFVSTNGLHWEALAVPSQSGFLYQAVAYGNGRWVLGAYDGRADVSPDLMTWTNVTTQLFSPEGATFINGRFLLPAADGLIGSSTSGLNWSVITNRVTSRRLYGVAYNVGLYVAVGARGTIITASDDASFIWQAQQSPTPNRLEDVLYANGLFVAVGENGTVLTSYNGVHWVNQTRGLVEDLDDLEVSANLAVAVGKNDTVLLSTDGRSWSLAPVPRYGADWHGVTFGDGKIVVVGQTTNVLVSPDNGATWSLHPFAHDAAYLKSIIYARGLWVAVGEGGLIVTSPDAVNWTRQLSPVSYDLNDIAYGHDQFVIVGDQFPSPTATILTSQNGTNWLDRTYPLGKNARAVTFAYGRFVVAANDGHYLVSTNPALQQWTAFTTPESDDGDNNRDVTAASNIWVIVGNRGIIATARQGTNGPGTFQERRSQTVENLHAVRYFKGSFVAVGNRGLVLQSNPLQSRLEIGRDNSQLRLLFSSPYEGVFQLEESADFGWQEAGLLTNVVGTVQRTVSPTNGHRFYRVVPVQP